MIDGIGHILGLETNGVLGPVERSALADIFLHIIAGIDLQRRTGSENLHSATGGLQHSGKLREPLPGPPLKGGGKFQVSGVRFQVSCVTP